MNHPFRRPSSLRSRVRAISAALLGAVFLTVQTATPAGAMQRLETLEFPDDGGFSLGGNTLSAVDSVNRIGYFATTTSLVKVDLATMRTLEAVSVSNLAQYGLTSLSPTITNGFLYATTAGAASKIVKIQVSPLAVVGTLDTTETGPAYVAVDAAGGYGYTGSRKIVRFRLSDFTLAGESNLNADEMFPRFGLIDGSAGNFYLGMQHGNVSAVGKIRLSDMSRLATLDLPIAYSRPIGEIDLARHALYIGANNPNRIDKIDLTSFALANSPVLFNNSTDGGIYSFQVDGQAGALVVAHYHSQSLRYSRVRLSDFTKIGTVTIPIDGNKGDVIAAIDAAHRRLYLGTNHSPARLIAVDLDSDTTDGQLVFRMAATSFFQCFLDASKEFGLFLSPSNTQTGVPNIVFKVRLSDSKIVATTILPVDTPIFATDVNVSDNDLYMVTLTPPVSLVKMRVSDLVVEDHIATGINEFVDGLHIDAIHQRGYLISTITGGKISRFSLNPFQVLPGYALPTRPHAYVFDDVSETGYFVFDTPVRLGKVRLSDGAVLSSLNLAIGENYGSAGLDSAHDLLYLAGNTLVKIQASSLTRLASIPRVNTEGVTNAAAFDFADDEGYFGLGGTPGKILLVRLSDFTRVETLSLNAGESINLRSLVLDVARRMGFAAMFVTGANARLMRFSLGAANAPPPQRGTLQFSSAAYSVNESSRSLTVAVTRTDGTDGAVGVSYATTPGTAGASDFTATLGTLSWPAGTGGTRTFSIPIADDAAVEGNETFTIALANSTGGAALGTPASAVVTIIDNDAPHYGALSLQSATYAVLENAGALTVTARRIGGTDGAVGLRYATANGTAGGADFTVATGTLAWAAGDGTVKTFLIPIANDTLVEGNESFTVTVSSPTGGATMDAPASAVVTILDDESPQRGVFSLSPAAIATSEDADSISVTVTRASGDDGIVAVHYRTVDGTATAGSDYTATSGTLAWDDGMSGPKTVMVPISDDNVSEDPETFAFALDNPQGDAVLGSPSTITVTIADNDAPVSEPHIASIDPDHGPVDGGTAVRIRGTGFVSGAVVAFGTARASGVRFVDATEVDAVAPAATSAGPVNVRLTNADSGDDVSGNGFTYQNPAGQNPTDGGPSVVPTASVNGEPIQFRNLSPGSHIVIRDTLGHSIATISESNGTATWDLSASGRAAASGTYRYSVNGAKSGTVVIVR